MSPRPRNTQSLESRFTRGIQSYRCRVCNGIHPLKKCRRFLRLSAEKGLRAVLVNRYCSSCLTHEHSGGSCRRGDGCQTCGQDHHTLLHPVTEEHRSRSAEDSTRGVNFRRGSGTSRPSSAICPSSGTHKPIHGHRLPGAPEVAEPVASSPSTANALVAQGRSGDISLLATANIFVRSRAGSLVPCRALLDSGSQVHVITSRLASQLQLRRYKSFMAVSGIGDTGFATDGFSVDVLLRSHCSQYSALVNAVIAANITELQPSFSLDVSSWNIPGNLSLADPEFFRPQRIDLLIGASLFYELLCVGQIKLSAGLPLLQKTRLGWVVCGGGSHI
ncbi:hypothetical protein KR074_011174, partial [Drosophila pseudoananassae]